MAGRHKLRTRHQGGRISPMPNITPVVNVALVLLIVFMVVMPMIREGIEVETPQARTSEQLEDAAEQLVVLSVLSDGSVFVNLTRVDRHTIKDELTLAYRGMEGSPVIIKGARNLPYSEIIELMEVCQGIGAPSVDLMARKER